MAEYTDDARLSSSLTVDCLFLSLSSSSSSSAISFNLRRRKELEDDEAEPEAVCSEQAAESLLSFKSLATEISKVISYGRNRSQTALKCTAARAIRGQQASD